MKYFISLLLLVFSPLIWGMDPDFMFTADDFISSTEFKRQLDERIQTKIREHRESLPPCLRDGLPELEEYNSEDYEDVRTPEGRRRYEEASEAFDRDGPTAPAYIASEAIHRAKRQARLEREARLARQQAAQQPNGRPEDLEEEEGDDSASGSSTDEEAPTVIDWDAVEAITEKSKEKPDPMDWLSKIDWTSLETSPAVSPSKRAAINPSIELLKGVNWRKLSSLPHYGWSFKERRELEVGGKCDLCNHSLHHGYVLFHPESREEICVGKICASRLRKDRDVIERERQTRLSSDASLNALIAAIQYLSVE